MNMIDHQAKSMDSIFIPFQPLLQKKVKANTIDIRTKDILTTIATKHDVVKCARKMYAWFTSHTEFQLHNVKLSSLTPVINSRQLEFLSLLKDFIIEREKVEKRDLIQSPFTILHPQGIRGVFRPKEIDEILQFTEKLAA